MKERENSASLAAVSRQSVSSQTPASLRDIQDILVRRKRSIVLTFLLVVAVVTTVTLLMPKQYDSQMEILVKNERAEMVVTPNENTSSDYLGEVSEEEINTEIELLNSRDLLQEVVLKTGLETSGKPVGNNRPLVIEKAVRELQSDLKIAPVRKANIIEVDYSGTDPHLVAAVLRQLAASYLELHLRAHGTPGTYEFFADQTARYRDQLHDAEARLEEFSQTDNIVMLEQQKEAILQKVSQSDAEMSEAKAAIGDYTSQIADARRQLSAAPPRVTTQSRTLSNQYSVEQLSTMIAQLQNQHTQLLAKFRPDDRLVLENGKEIADTQSALQKAINLTGTDQSTDINPLHQTLEIDLAKEESELSGIQAKYQTLTGQAQSYRGQLMTLGNATAKYDDLMRAQKEAEDNYLLYSKKTEEARIAESLDRQKIANVAIVETPEESHLPSKPNVRLNLALGVLFAGFLSMGTAFASEYLMQPEGGTPHDVTIAEQHLLEAVEEPSELEELTGVPVLAIPYRRLDV